MNRHRFRTSAAVRAAAGLLLLAPLAVACSDPPANGLTGTALTYDDTGRDPSPITKGWIIAVPAAAADDVWNSTNAMPLSQLDLRHMVGQLISRDRVAQAGGAVAPLDDDGEFVLHVKQGDYLICHLNPAADGGTDPVQGCGFLTLPASGELDIADGEGGFSVSIKK